MMPPIRRINLYGGPGSGKSTTAPAIYNKLKNKFIHENINLHVEIVLEYIKNWAHEGRKPMSFDQVYIFAQQMHREDVLLRNDVDLIVTDSPLLMNYTYGEVQNRPGYKGLLSVVDEFEEAFPGIHIFLDRADRPYVTKGRYQTAEAAKEMDSRILDMMTKKLKKFHVIKYDQVDSMVGKVLFELGALEQ